MRIIHVNLLILFICRGEGARTRQTKMSLELDKQLSSAMGRIPVIPPQELDRKLGHVLIIRPGKSVNDIFNKTGVNFLEEKPDGVSQAELDALIASPRKSVLQDFPLTEVVRSVSTASVSLGIPVAELELEAAKESTRYLKIIVTQRKITDLTNSMRMQNFIVKYLDQYLLTAASGLEEVLRGRRTQAIGALRLVLGVVVICETGKIVAKLIETVNASGEAKAGTNKDGVTHESVKRTETSGKGTVGMGLKLIKLQKKVGSGNIEISFARANTLNSKALEDAQSWASNTSCRWIPAALRQMFYPATAKYAIALPDGYSDDRETYVDALANVNLAPQVEGAIVQDPPGHVRVEYDVSREVPNDEELHAGDTDDDNSDGASTYKTLQDNYQDAPGERFGSIKVAVLEKTERIEEVYSQVKNQGKFPVGNAFITGITPAYAINGILPVFYDDKGKIDRKVPGAVHRYDAATNCAYLVPVLRMNTSTTSGSVTTYEPVTNPPTATFLQNKWEVSEVVEEIPRRAIETWKESHFYQVDPLKGERVGKGNVLVCRQVLRPYGTSARMTSELALEDRDTLTFCARKEASGPDGPDSEPDSPRTGGCCVIL